MPLFSLCRFSMIFCTKRFWRSGFSMPSNALTTVLTTPLISAASSDTFNGLSISTTFASTFLAALDTVSAGVSSAGFPAFFRFSILSASAFFFSLYLAIMSLHFSNAVMAAFFAGASFASFGFLAAIRLTGALAGVSFLGAAAFLGGSLLPFSSSSLMSFFTLSMACSITSLMSFGVSGSL